MKRHEASMSLGGGVFTVFTLFLIFQAYPAVADSTAVDDDGQVGLTIDASGVRSPSVRHGKAAQRSTSISSQQRIVPGQGRRSGKPDLADGNTAIKSAVGSPLFLPYVTYPVGSWPEAVAIGDLDGDGRNDVVMVTSYYFDAANDYRVFVFYQNELGRFSAPQKLLTSGTYINMPKSVAIGDINSDGLPDILVGNSGLNIEVFLQQPNRSFGTSVKYPTSHSLKIRVADLNSDGRLDVVGIGWGGAEAAVFLQKNDGTLDLPVLYPAPHGGYDDLEVGDINSDGRVDIVVMSGQYYAYNNLAVLYQNTSGTFDGVVFYDLGGDELTQGVTIGDYNNDGRNDVVVTFGGNSPSSKLGIFYQNAGGLLNAPVMINTYDIPEPVEMADVDGDGLKDVVVAHGGWLALGVHRQGLEGKVLPEELYPLPYATRYDPHGLAVGDVSGDGKPDVVLADYNNGLVVLYSSAARKASYCPGARRAQFAYQDDLENISSGRWATGVASGVNHWTGCAGTPDVYCTGAPNSGNYSFWGYGYGSVADSFVAMTQDVAVTGDMSFEFESVFNLEPNFDGGVVEYSTNSGVTWSDAGPLISSGQEYSGTLSGAYGNPLGGRQAFTGNNGGYYLPSVLNLDSLAGNNVRFRFRLATDSANASPGWAIDDVVLYSCSMTQIAGEDYNKDGRADLLWRHTSGLTVQWLMNGPNVLSSASLGGDGNWLIVHSGDFNGDGKTDILWRHISGLSVMWLMDAATMKSAASLGGDSNWQIINSGDFNGDGKSDLLWRHTSGLTVMWLMDGSTVASSSEVGGDADWTVNETGDFNGDGKSDLLWRHTSGLTVQWLMNGATVTAATSLGGDLSWTVTQTGDLNGDGKSDLLWRHTSGLTVLWFMDGATTTSSASLGGDVDWTIIKTGDYNGDGKADLLWRHTSGLTVMWLMDGATMISAASLGGDGNWTVQ